MNKVFNTIFENSLRVLLLLSTESKAKNADMISALDFITIYNKTLSVGEKDLHGQNPFAFCEYTARREIINAAIKDLVLRGLVNVEKQARGFCYKINNNGKKAISQFDNDYAKDYLCAINFTINFAKGKNEQKLIAFINDKANELGGSNE